MDLLKLLLVVGFLGLLYALLMPRAPLRIVVHRSRVRVFGTRWVNRAGTIADFFRDDLPEVESARVEGSWDGQRLRLRFHGALTPGQQQRIRNFLLTLR
jgi:hypothetical protein